MSYGIMLINLCNRHDNITLLIPDLLIGIGLRLLAIVAVVLVLTALGNYRIFKFVR
jgi:hypothetical protein